MEWLDLVGQRWTTGQPLKKTWQIVNNFSKIIKNYSSNPKYSSYIYIVIMVKIETL